MYEFDFNKEQEFELTTAYDISMAQVIVLFLSCVQTARRLTFLILDLKSS